MEKAPMSTEPLSRQAGTEMPDHTSPQRADTLSDPPEPPVEVAPYEQRGTVTWVQAADPAGTLRASKEVPEPDSLGG
jgi:hypothetical protein